MSTLNLLRETAARQNWPYQFALADFVATVIVYKNFVPTGEISYESLNKIRGLEPRLFAQELNGLIKAAIKRHNQAPICRPDYAWVCSGTIAKSSVLSAVSRVHRTWPECKVHHTTFTFQDIDGPHGPIAAFRCSHHRP